MISSFFTTPEAQAALGAGLIILAVVIFAFLIRRRAALDEREAFGVEIERSRKSGLYHLRITDGGVHTIAIVPGSFKRYLDASKVARRIANGKLIYRGVTK